MWGKRLKNIEDKLDKYHDTVLQNHNDLKWIKRIGSTAIVIVLPLIIANSCSEESFNGQSNSVKKWVNVGEIVEGITGPKYWQ